MGKETKFLSIALCLLQGIKNDSGCSANVPYGIDADRLYKYIQYVDDNFVDDSKRRTNEVDYPAKNDRNRFHQNGNTEKNKKFGNIYIETRLNGSGTPAQVKFFKLLENEEADTFNRVNGKITMIREMTGYDGCLSRKIPVGRYIIEISKGSEIEIITDDIEMYEGKVSKKEYDLNRFINLEEEGWIAGELHHHSIYSSPVFGGDDDVVETPEQIACSMLAMGLGFGALSDHHNILNHRAWKANKRDDFVPIISKEISTSNGHVMAMGVAEDVIYAIPDDLNRTDVYLRNEFVRITDEIKENGGLAQINHPRDLQKSLSWNPDFNDMLDIFETMEIWNGSNPMMSGSTNDAARKLWMDCMKKGIFIPATTGSDTHNICANDYHVFFDRLMDIKDAINANEREITEIFPLETQVMKEIFIEILPVLEKWAETCLTSGCVRTYVNFDSTLPKEVTHTPVNIMNILRRGNSFLTNGPILLSKVNGKIPGERVKVLSGKEILDIELKIVSNRILKSLIICTENGARRKVELKSNKNNGFFDYSMSFSEPVQNDNYMYFMVQDDCTNMAITNPVIICR